MSRGDSFRRKTRRRSRSGDQEKYKETARVVKPQFDLETYPNARVREGADELTLRSEETGKALASSLYHRDQL